MNSNDIRHKARDSAARPGSQLRPQQHAPQRSGGRPPHGYAYDAFQPTPAPNPMHIMTFPETTVPLPDVRTVATSAHSIAAAARTGDVKMLQYHLAASPRDIVNARFDAQLTTLLLLCARFAPDHDPDYPSFNGNQAIAYLLSRNANANAADSKGFTPLYEVAKRGPKFVDAVAALLKAGAKANPRNADGVTVLHIALRRHSEDPAPVLRALIAAQVDVNQRSNGGVTPLFIAARYCADPTRAMRLLLRAGADPNGESGFDVPGDQPKFVRLGSPLVALVNYSKNPLPAMRMLVAAGAELRQARHDYVNVYAHGDEPIRTPNQIEELFRELVASTSNKGPSPAPDAAPAPVREPEVQLPGMEKHTVWTAAAAGREDIVAYYMRRSPHLFGHVSDKRNNAPSTYVLAHAVIGKHTNLVKTLIQALPQLRAEAEDPGAGFDINAIDNNGMSALLYGIQCDSQREVQLLLLNGADPTLRGPMKPRKWYAVFGKRKPWENALMFAIDTGRLSCTRSILEWHNRNPRLRLDLKKVEKAVNSSPNNMMVSCFNKFQRQRTLANVARNPA